MRLSVRLILSLIAGITVVTFLFARYQVQSQKRWLWNDLATHSQMLGQSLEEVIEPLLSLQSGRLLQGTIDRFGASEHVFGIAIYNPAGNVLAITPQLRSIFKDPPALVARCMRHSRGLSETFEAGPTPFQLYATPLLDGNTVEGALIITQDGSYIDRQSARIWRTTVQHVLVQVLLIVLITLLIVRWTIVNPLAKTAHWVRALRTGKAWQRPPDLGGLHPVGTLAAEVTHLARSLTAARSAAREEARLRATAESTWTAERLRVFVESKLGRDRLFVVSNREPYSHQSRGNSFEVIVPASGLVTAIEPVLCACHGTWIAHGSGDADREAVDAHDRLSVPPGDPQYVLRRVWLNKDEEAGYYYGFANEGLWPLCHIAYTRPIFRASDWQYYQKVNERFAEVALSEMGRVADPSLLVQDYHFALLPRIVKERRPGARIAIFWHIPWPHPDAFRVCPWQQELLDGLLGADLIAFHIQAHCTNFLETVDRTLESRIDWERFAVNRGGHSTLVKPYPISVVFPEENKDSAAVARGASLADRDTLLKQHGVEAPHMGIGVDRVDYTKGILERFLAIDRFFEKYPDFRGQFTFVQVGAPSRTRIRRYLDLLSEVRGEAERINWKFETGKWKPIILLERHHGRSEVQAYYRAADLCLVTSLHDGMNMVAKEFVAAREDNQGVLVLSAFTGASRELMDALIVNPYDIEGMADLIHAALTMDARERETRMRRMRQTVRENNIYCWAADLIGGLSEIRPEEPVAVEANLP
jgi:trehalose-6-phosphate synthase/uncharacterized membrane protein affecting hemolysin expression